MGKMKLSINFSIIFCLLTALHKLRNISVNFLVLHSSGDNSSRPAAFQLVIFDLNMSGSNSVTCPNPTSECQWIFFDRLINEFWRDSKHFLEIFFSLLHFIFLFLRYSFLCSLHLQSTIIVYLLLSVGFNWFNLECILGVIFYICLFFLCFFKFPPIVFVGFFFH